MSSQHRKQSTSLNFGRYFVIKVSIRFKGEVHLENLYYSNLMDSSSKDPPVHFLVLYGFFDERKNFFRTFNPLPQGLPGLNQTKREVF